MYKHISPNNKVYIGITSRNPKLRWNNGNGYRSNTYFWNSIKKYGWDNFEHEIIAEHLTKEEACDLEKSLIKEYNSTNRINGFNISIGGEYPNSGGTHIVSEEQKLKMRKLYLGRKISDKQKLKISKTLTGRKFSDETRKKLSELRIGKKHSDETKQKMSNKKKNRKWTENQRKSLHDHLDELHSKHLSKLHESRKKKVMNLDTSEIFESVKEAGKSVNRNSSNISNCCKGKRNTCGGFHWEYYEELKGENYEYFI